MTVMTAPTTMIGRPAGGLAQPTHTEAPDLVAALDAIDLQLAAGSDGVVLPRDAAALVACALHDLLDVRPITVADLRNTGAWKKELT